MFPSYNLCTLMDFMDFLDGFIFTYLPSNNITVDMSHLFFCPVIYFNNPPSFLPKQSYFLFLLLRPKVLPLTFITNACSVSRFCFWPHRFDFLQLHQQSQLPDRYIWSYCPSLSAPFQSCPSAT